MEIHPFWLIGAAGVLALVPVLLGVASTYLKISIVLGLIKNALGAQQVPGPIIVSALSIALTFYVISPVCTDMVDRYKKIEPTLKKEAFSIQTAETLTPVVEPLIVFLGAHSGEREIQALLEFRNNTLVRDDKSSSEASKEHLSIIIPAFMLTELREAFMMGFVVLLPFLVIDLIVANLLTGLGMYMMSPVTISLPLKLILFVASDAWLFIVRGLLQSYGAS